MNKQEEQILNIKVKYEDAINGILKYKEHIDELAKSQEKLRKDFESGKITQEEYAQTVTAIGEQTKSYKSTIRELSKEVQNNIKTEKEQEGSLRALRAELSNATKAYDSLSETERKGAKGQELKKHINEITDKLKGAEEETQRFYRNVGNYEESIKSALGVNSNFANSILQMAQNGKGASGFFNEASVSAKAFGRTLMGLMANPVFLALAGIAGVGVTFKWFFDYNKGIEESTRLTKEFLGLTGNNLKAMRDEIQATADTYGKDYKETLEAVDVLTSQYGMDAQKALEIINKGFQSGADLNGDMIDKIKKYAPAFHDANIGAEQLLGTIQQTRSGIFSDAGMDLIQMASKKIREMQKSTSDSLNAIGIDSRKLQDDLASGSKSMYDVIKMVSTKLKELPQNSREVGDVLRDVFGRQGANAGLKMIEQLDTMNIDLDNLTGTTGEYGEKLDEQRKASAELNSTMSALFDVSEKGFGEMLISVKTLTLQGITSLMKGVINVINYFIDLYNESVVVRAGVQSIVGSFKNLWQVVKLVFNMVIDAMKGIGRNLKGLADVVEGIVTFSFDKIKKGFNQILKGSVKSIKEGWNDIKTFSKASANNVIDSINDVIKNKKVEHIKIPVSVSGNGKTSDDSVSNNKGGVTTRNGISNGLDVKNGRNNISAEKMAKMEAMEIRKAEELLSEVVEQTEEERRKQIAAQYDMQIADLRKKLENERGLTENAKKAIAAQIIALEKIKEKEIKEFDLTVKGEAIKREQTYIQNMLASVEKGTKEEYKLRVNAIRNEYQLELDAAREQVMNEEEKNRLLESINAKYYEQEQLAYEEYHNKMLEEQTRAIEDRFKERILKTEIASNGNDELSVLRLQMEERQEILESAQQMEGESIEAFNLRKLQLERNYQESKKSVSEKEIDIERGKYEAISGMIGATAQIAEAFSENSKGMAKASKVLALAEISINTGVALAQGIKQAQSVPFPANIAAIATTVTTILANVASAIKTVKSAKFASGGLVTGPGSETSDSIPARLSNGESVMTARATTMFAPALSAFNQIGGGVPIMSNSNGGAQIGEDFLARAIARGMAAAPRPVVSVEEITETKSRIETIERLAALR